MKELKLKCDIKNRPHKGEVKTRKIQAVFDHDQEDGKSKTEPYLDNVEIEMCDECYFREMIAMRTYVSAFGAMGYNEYWFAD